MAYTLTLSLGERQAIDWVGGRYRHGDELYKCLWRDSAATPDDADWDDPRDITFTVPEPTAWRVGEIVDAGLDCFGDTLSAKLRAFRDAVV